MSVHDQVPGSSADWMARDRGDLAIAKSPLPDGAFYEDLCFHAQQAAEKSLKAVYRHYGLVFKYTHDLDELICGLKREGIEVPEAVIEADILSRFAWESRYPYIGEQVKEEEYLEAVDQAETVVKWAQTIISLL